MKDTKKIYGQFQLLQRNRERQLTKVPYSSMQKYTKSPYLQRLAQPSLKKHSFREETPKNEQKQQIGSDGIKIQQSSRHQLPKLTTPIKYKQGEVINYFKGESQTLEHHHHLSHGIKSIGSHSATLEINTMKKTKLEPINKSHRLHFAMKTRAGTSGKQAKINQDMGIVQLKLPFGVKLFCVCDGHGVNGHFVSTYIKTNLLKSLSGSLKKLVSAPTLEELKGIVRTSLVKTNQRLLASDINTQLSGSTVVAIILFGNQIISFNIGDSRAIMAKQLIHQTETVSERAETQKEEKRSDLSDGFKIKQNNCVWTVKELSIDQKPERKDECERIINNGGRVFSQKNEKGQDLGPLRVWMKDLMMPGLAMTRSFGDKAGLKAGTCAQPQILEFQLTEEDKFMVVASDGIWQYLQNNEVMNLIVPLYLKDDLDSACERLVRVSSEVWQKVSYSRDDITIIIVSLNPPLK